MLPTVMRERGMSLAQQYDARVLQSLEQLLARQGLVVCRIEPLCDVLVATAARFNRQGPVARGQQQAGSNKANPCNYTHL